MLKALSALTTPLNGRDGADGRRRLRLSELRGWHVVQLGVFTGGHAALATAVRTAVGFELPVSPTEATVLDAAIVFRIAADQYWVVTPDPSLVTTLALAVPADAGTVTPLSESRTRLVIEGPDSRTVLSRLVALDLHPGVFSIGHFAQAGVHHVGGLLYRAAADRYEFFALRTYAVSIWEVLADAALPIGYDASF